VLGEKVVLEVAVGIVLCSIYWTSYVFIKFL